MKYEVYGTVVVNVTVTVEADSKNAAIEKAYEEFGGLKNYCGNGASGGKLVGTSSQNVHIEAGGGSGDAEFLDAEPV